MEQQNFTLASIDFSQGRMFCGPTVLAMLTGKTRAGIHRDVNKLRRKAGEKRNKWSERSRCWKRIPWPLTAPVKGLHNSQLEKLMEKYGLSAKPHNSKYPSLRQFFDDAGHLKMPIVVNITGHYVLYFQGQVYDTYRPCGVPLHEHPCAGRRVQKYWLLPSKNSLIFRWHHENA